MSGDPMRAEMEEELRRLIETEKDIDAELSQYFTVIAEGKSVSSGLSYESSSDLSHSLSKVEQFAPCFEVMAQGSSKLVGQIDECHGLSDRLSVIVRRLDDIQIRAQEALACTEDVINIKDCKTGVLAAIEDHNLPLAVSFIKQVHDIDQQAAKASDDYKGILEAEKQVCSLVRAEFEAAIQSSNIDLVLKLCPLLQTVGLEVEARDTFMAFMEENIFISLSADAADIDSTDHATAYAQTLASIFNNACLIYQQYLPVVIQGMEKSNGDVVFIRLLHSKCTKEAGVVLKRYMKFRGVKSSIGAATRSSSVLSSMSNAHKTSAAGTSVPPSPAEMHQILDEIAIILQYCCSYGQYVSLLCKGAEDRPRGHSQSLPSHFSSLTPHSSSHESDRVRVFSGPSDFDHMVDELVNSYYLEGEHWLMLWGIECITKAVKKHTSDGRSAPADSTRTVEDSHFYDDSDDDGSGDFDGCFFVLQRCSQRAIATNNINAACAILRFMVDHLSNELLQHLTLGMDHAVRDLSAHISDVMNNILRPAATSTGSVNTLAGIAKGLSLTKGLKNVGVFASGMISEQHKHKNQPDEEGVEGALGLNSAAVSAVAAMQVFDSVELCARYVASLKREISSSSGEVFGSDVTNADAAVTSDSLVKINMCLENFDECKESFEDAISLAASGLAAHCESLMTELLTKILGAIHFEYEGDKFDSQEAVQMIPKLLVDPFEIVLRLCTEPLSDSNKDMLVGMLASGYASCMENFILKATFSFAGSLKLEECVRALNQAFSSLSTVSLRKKFSRLREVLVVLTSDSTLLPAPASASATSTLPLTQLHNLSQLTEAEAHSFLTLRSDFIDYQ